MPGSWLCTGTSGSSWLLGIFGVRRRRSGEHRRRLCGREGLSWGSDGLEIDLGLDGREGLSWGSGRLDLGLDGCRGLS